MLYSQNRHDITATATGLRSIGWFDFHDAAPGHKRRRSSFTTAPRLMSTPAASSARAALRSRCARTILLSRRYLCFSKVVCSTVTWRRTRARDTDTWPVDSQVPDLHRYLNHRGAVIIGEDWNPAPELKHGQFSTLSKKHQKLG